MATLDYRFTKSTPILRDLGRARSVASSPLPTSSSEHIEKVNPFEFIDSSLGLLANLQKAQDNDLRREFEQQRDFINEKFEREQYEHGRRDQAIDQRFTKIKEKLENFKQEVGQRFEEVGQRFEEVGQRFEEVGQRFDRVDQRFEEVGQRFDQVEQRFDEMRAMMFNSLSYRAHDHIHPVAVFIGNRLRKPDETYFPRNIREFWSLHARSPKKAYDRFRLLQFYSIEGYQRWNRENEFGTESDEGDSSLESLTLDDAARSYPSKCLEALAVRLGLNYDKICAQMQQLQERRQQTPAQPSKRPQAGVVSPKAGEISKKAHRSPAPSTMSGVQRKQSDSRKALPIRNSQETTELVSETDMLGTEQRSQGSTDVHSFEGT